MINRADIPFADAAFCGADLRGLLILIRLWACHPARPLRGGRPRAI